MGTTPTQPPAPPPGPPPTPPPGGPPAPPPGYGQPGYPPGYRPPSSSGKIVAAVVITVVVVAAGAGVFFFLSNQEEPPPPPPPSPTVPPTTPPTTQPTTPPTTPPTPPPDASLDDLLLPRVGSFNLVSVQPDPQAISSLGAADALIANYLRGDGTQIIHNLMVFTTGLDADIAKRNLAKTLQFQLGYVVTGRLARQGIQATRLAGPDEIIIWTNGQLLALAEGPFGVTEGFFTVLPY